MSFDALVIIGVTEGSLCCNDGMYGNVDGLGRVGISPRPLNGNIELAEPSGFWHKYLEGDCVPPSLSYCPLIESASSSASSN